jgi:hypothetical protein
VAGVVRKPLLEHAQLPGGVVRRVILAYSNPMAQVSTVLVRLALSNTKAREPGED